MTSFFKLRSIKGCIYMLLFLIENISASFSLIYGQSDGVSGSREEMQIQSQAFSSQDDIWTFFTEPTLLSSLIFVIVLVFLGLVLMNIFSRNQNSSDPNRIEKLEADHLFLGFQMDILNSKNNTTAITNQTSSLPTAYMRSLSCHDASFVYPEKLAKNTQIKIDLSSLPSFPQPSAAKSPSVEQLPVKAHVTSCRPISSSEPGYLIHGHFDEISPEMKALLLTYLDGLAHKSEYSSHVT